MATSIIMPRQGQSVESCIITKWHKKKGDHVKKGDILFTYETDKATFDEQSSVDGTLLEVFFNEDDEVPVLQAVCIIGNEGEDVKISPRAKNLAENLGIDYKLVEPSGPNNRIIERDIVTRAAKDEYMKIDNKENISGTGIGGRVTTRDLENLKSENLIKDKTEKKLDYEEIKISNIRKVIADSMHHSLTSTAQLTLNASFDATQILEMRNNIKKNKENLGISNITINDMIAFAVSRVLFDFKDLNSHFLEDKIRIFNNVHLGVAIDTERGLMVPTIFNANKKSLTQMSQEITQLASKCKEGTINPDLLKDGTFTVSNLGSIGVENFTPIINTPQTGILGVGTITQRVKEVSGEYVFYPSITLSLTIDHRAVDGAPAARFLQQLVLNLENFMLLLAK